MGTRREIEEKKESVVMSSSSSSSHEWTPEEEGKGGGEEGNAQKRGGRRLVWLPVTALVATGVCYAIMYGFFFRSDKDPEEEQPDVAYISEVGDYPPQSCFFTLGCTGHRDAGPTERGRPLSPALPRSAPRPLR